MSNVVPADDLPQNAATPSIVPAHDLPAGHEKTPSIGELFNAPSPQSWLAKKVVSGIEKAPNLLGEKTTDIATKMGAPVPVAAGLGTAANVGLTAATMYGGGAKPAKFAMEKGLQAVKAVPEMIGEARVARQAAASARGPAMETSRMATELGMKVPPQERAVGESGAIANKFRTVTDTESLAAHASVDNSKKVQLLIKSDLGLPPEMPITRANLKTKIAEEGKVFDAIRNIPDTFRTDRKYAQELESVGTSYSDTARNYPNIFGRQKIDPLIADLNVSEILPHHAVDLMRTLREKATNYLNSSDAPSREMGMVYRDAAEAIEGVTERGLEKTGNKELYGQFVAARQRTAKLYDALGALHEPSGTLDPQFYGKLFEKQKPLSGNAEQVGRLANAYPDYFQSAPEAAGKLTGSHKTGFGVMTEILGPQALARKALLSKNIPWSGTK